MDVITSQHLRDNWRRCREAAAYEDKVFVVTYYGDIPVAVLLSPQTWRRGLERVPHEGHTELGVRDSRTALRRVFTAARQGTHTLITLHGEENAVIVPYRWTQEALPELIQETVGTTASERRAATLTRPRNWPCLTGCGNTPVGPKRHSPMGPRRRRDRMTRPRSPTVSRGCASAPPTAPTSTHQVPLTERPFPVGMARDDSRDALVVSGTALTSGSVAGGDAAVGDAVGGPGEAAAVGEAVGNGGGDLVRGVAVHADVVLGRGGEQVAGFVLVE